MSLILDALRKSEAERRRGQAPSLYADVPAPATRLQPAWMPWLPVAAGVLLMVGIAVWYTRDADVPVTKEELVDDSDGKSLVPPSPAQNAANGNSVAVVAAPAAPPKAPPPVNPAAPPKDSVDALVKPPVNQAAAAVDAKTNPTAAASADVGATVATTPAATPAPAATPEEEVPPVAVLDPSTRAGLPPMKLSMHVYNTDPTRRFAVIDGQRVTEGSQLGSAIVLEIRRDGVLLDVSGRRVLLPRP